MTLLEQIHEITAQRISKSFAEAVSLSQTGFYRKLLEEKGPK